MDSSRGHQEVICPDCGHEQSEPRLAVSTYCRGCGRHLNLLALEEGAQKEKSAPPTPAEIIRAKARGEIPIGEVTETEVGRWSHLNPIGRPPLRSVICPECFNDYTVHKVSTTAFCTECGFYVNLADHEIRGRTNRNILTGGDITVYKGGAIQSSRITCRNLTVLGGEIKGKILCTGKFHFQGDAKVLGRIDCDEFVVDPHSTISCFQTVRAQSAEVMGDATARIICEGKIRIGSGALLRGDVVGGAVIIDKGGSLDGTMEIRQPASSS